MFAALLFAALLFEALLFAAQGAWCAAAFPTHTEEADKEAGITTGARGAAKTTVPTTSAMALNEVTSDIARTNTARAFARNPDFVTARISPDGHYLAVTKYDEGFCALLVLDLHKCHGADEIVGVQGQRVALARPVVGDA